MDDGDIDPWQKRAYFQRLKKRSMLSEWYGPAYAATEISSYGAKVRPASDYLEEVTRNIFSRDTLLKIRLEKAWPEVVGAPFSGMCQVGSFDNGILTLEVRHSIYRSELENAFELLQAFVNRFAGENICTGIRLEAANRRSRNFCKPKTS